MKDKHDPGTTDAFPRKGRPPLATSGRPMTAAERQRRRREELASLGQLQRCFILDAKLWDKFMGYCERHEKSADKIVSDYLTKLVADRQSRQRKPA